jgi:hypothetical protein
MKYHQSGSKCVFNRFVGITAALALALPFVGQTAGFAQSTKRGLGLQAPVDTPAGIALNTARLANINAVWYYDWSYSGIYPQDQQYDFVHMVWTGSYLATDPVPTPPYAHILGFNEPDGSTQANMTPAQAIADWPAVIARGTFVVSPATGQSPISGNYPEGSSNPSWLSQFMSTNPKVDAIAVHSYGCDAAHLQTLLTDIYNKWGKPIWLTEFACETGSEAEGNGSHPSQADVDAFIGNIKPFLDNTTWIQRYAWHDSKVGTSALFTIDSTGKDETSSTLSETGNLLAGNN